MNKSSDNNQFIFHNSKSYECFFIAFSRGEWEFRILGVDNGIFCGEDIEFLGSKLKVCYTERDGAITIVQAWTK